MDNVKNLQMSTEDKNNSKKHKKNKSTNFGPLLICEDQMNLAYHYEILEANHNLIKNIKRNLKLMILKNVSINKLRATANVRQ
jgi:hypothetical protein